MAQVGPAIVDVLFGRVSPSAKLPVTFPNSENEQEMGVEQYPGVPAAGFKLQAKYTEGQIVGYRWYDKHSVTPAFPFGHGLTYGTFSFDQGRVSGRTVSFRVVRTAGRGCETPQLYLSYPSASADARVPSKVLRYFSKACDATNLVSYTLSDDDVSNWDPKCKQWVLTPGTYGVEIGASSQDIRLSGSLVVGGDGLSTTETSAMSERLLASSR